MRTFVPALLPRPQARLIQGLVARYLAASAHDEAEDQEGGHPWNHEA